MCVCAPSVAKHYPLRAVGTGQQPSFSLQPLPPRSGLGVSARGARRRRWLGGHPFATWEMTLQATGSPTQLDAQSVQVTLVGTGPASGSSVTLTAGGGSGIVSATGGAVRFRDEPIPLRMRERIVALYEQNKQTKEIAEVMGTCRSGTRRT